MRKAKWLLVIFLPLIASVSGQSPDEMGKTERTIRGLERSLVEAVLNRDLRILDTLFSDELIVSSPTNTIVKKTTVLQLVREKKISYSAYKGQIDKVIMLDDVVIVTGMESVEPIDNAPFAGTAIERRYSQVWRKQAGKWQLVFRQASIICPR